jgi:lipoprotein NlpD
MLAACATPVDEGPESYVVRPEDTLYSIAWRHDLDFRDLARWNRIGADFRISVGQVLRLGPNPAMGPPPRSQPGPARPVRAAPRTRRQEPARVGTPKRLPQPLPPLPAPSTLAGGSSATKWIWPTDHSSAPRSVPGGGLLFSGRLGQDVRAACAGRVVYAGNGLRGYGNLIIIKHGDNLLSAYAHNREMLVHDGQEVAMGQLIAHMGLGTPKSANLYFEIRQNGRPVDPLPFLPLK